jgi:hypothetical protein
MVHLRRAADRRLRRDEETEEDVIQQLNYYIIYEKHTLEMSNKSMPLTENPHTTFAHENACIIFENP